MAPASVELRPRVTAPFFARAGGYCTNGTRLFRVLRPMGGPNKRTVLLEDCWRGQAEDMDRVEALALRVVRYPPGVD